jgi:hypothetical protein
MLQFRVNNRMGRKVYYQRIIRRIQRREPAQNRHAQTIFLFDAPQKVRR